MSVAFLAEGTNIQVGVYDNPLCQFLKEQTPEEYFRYRHTNKVLAIPTHNNIIQFDPIEGYFSSEVIYKFVKSFSSSNRKTKAKMFELAVIRGAKEILYQSFSNYRELAKENPVECIEQMLNNNTPLIKMSHNFLPHVAKAFIKLKKEGHFKESYQPDSITHAHTFSVRKAVKHVKTHYKVKTMFKEYSYEVNLDQFMARSITPKLTKISNQNSKDNLHKMLSEHPEITEIYAWLGVDHLGIISDKLVKDHSTFKTQYSPIHKTINIDGNAIKFHIFPDRHGHSYAYDKLSKYAGKHGIKIPTPTESLHISTEYACNNSKKSLYFSDEELNFLICSTTTSSHNFDTLNACDEIFDMKDQVALDPSLCNVQDGVLTFSWYNDFLLRGICDENIHSEL